jgi:hypothetical protein
MARPVESISGWPLHEEWVVRFDGLTYTVQVGPSGIAVPAPAMVPWWAARLAWWRLFTRHTWSVEITRERMRTAGTECVSVEQFASRGAALDRAIDIVSREDLPLADRTDLSRQVRRTPRPSPE